MKILWIWVFIDVIRHAGGGVCDPGQVVYAIYPMNGKLERATVESLVVDGQFLVRWAMNPQLCENTSNRVPCVVDATITYNGKGELCATKVTTTTPSISTISPESPRVYHTQPSVFSPLEILGLLVACFLGIPLAGMLVIVLVRLIIRDPDPPESQIVLDAYITYQEANKVIASTHETRRDNILSFDFMAESSDKCIGDIIDEAVGIKGPEDLLKLVLMGVSVAILVVGWFMSRMQKYTTEWWSLFGFECVAALLMLSTSYVVLIVLPAIKQQEEPQISKKDD